jgi:hypothetical protein
MNLLILMVCGLLGIIAHWYVNYKRKRTTSTFKEYLFENGAETIHSLSANLGAVVAIYQVPTANTETFVLMCITAYLAGYKLDSVFNKDAKAVTVEPTKAPEERVIVRGEPKSIKEFVSDDKNKSINAILDDDANS